MEILRHLIHKQLHNMISHENFHCHSKDHEHHHMEYWNIGRQVKTEMTKTFHPTAGSKHEQTNKSLSTVMVQLRIQLFQYDHHTKYHTRISPSIHLQPHEQIGRKSIPSYSYSSKIPNSE